MNNTYFQSLYLLFVISVGAVLFISLFVYLKKVGVLYYDLAKIIIDYKLVIKTGGQLTSAGLNRLTELIKKMQEIIIDIVFISGVCTILFIVLIVLYVTKYGFN